MLLTWGSFERGIRAVGVISSAVLCGCFPHAQGIDLAKVSNAERAQAAAVQVYTIGQTAPKPEFDHRPRDGLLLQISRVGRASLSR